MQEMLQAELHRKTRGSDPDSDVRVVSITATTGVGILSIYGSTSFRAPIAQKRYSRVMFASGSPSSLTPPVVCTWSVGGDGVAEERAVRPGMGPATTWSAVSVGGFKPATAFPRGKGQSGRSVACCCSQHHSLRGSRATARGGYGAIKRRELPQQRRKHDRLMGPSFSRPLSAVGPASRRRGLDFTNVSPRELLSCAVYSRLLEVCF